VSSKECDDGAVRSDRRLSRNEAVIEEAVAAIRTGGLAVIPTDTVYGLACDPYHPEAVERLAAVKRRTPDQPIALVAASLDVLFECVPELRGRPGVVAQELLPGPYTLVFPNPARRYQWLAGMRPDTIGVRVPELAGTAKELLDRVGAVAATSANVHGGPDPGRLEDVPAEIRSAAAVVDGGVLPGVPSTVLDLTGPNPSLIRAGAAPAAEALARIRAVLAQ
jgi:L-threonylcarbamoyladenylate synthase